MMVQAKKRPHNHCNIVTSLEKQAIKGKARISPMIKKENRTFRVIILQGRTLFDGKNSPESPGSSLYFSNIKRKFYEADKTTAENLYEGQNKKLNPRTQAVRNESN